MERLQEDWAAIAANGAAVLGLSVASHALLAHHNSDFAPLPEEDEVLELFHAIRPATGAYILPSFENNTFETWTIKNEKGSVWIFYQDGLPSMSAAIAQSCAYNLGVSCLISWLLSKARPVEEDRFLFTAVLAAGLYSCAEGWEVIWENRTPAMFSMDIADSVAYGLATAAIFQRLGHH